MLLYTSAHNNSLIFDTRYPILTHPNKDLPLARPPFKTYLTQPIPRFPRAGGWRLRLVESGTGNTQ